MIASSSIDATLFLIFELHFTYLDSLTKTVRCCHGDTPEEVARQLTQIAESWVEDFLARGKKLPGINHRITRMGDGKDWKRSSRLLALREQTGLSQLAFASAIGVSVNTYRKWEQGVRTPSGSGAVLLTLIEQSPDTLKKLQSII